ncbi:(2Fe-2S)-binding protein [bacterium]|nr:(2Fe-2S)-binding protein [bacterium]
MKIEIKVNNKRYCLEIEHNLTLLDLLRDELGLTGTKRGCEIGECGACTVIMNGDAVNSCLVLAPQADGSEIFTVEGLEENGELSILQKAFIEHEAVHCGFCTPGMLMSAKALLDKNPHPTEEEIKIAISGNLCRCTGYKQIIEAIKSVSNQ